MLRQKGVRLIAINDGVDSFKGDDDFTPFRNIMNEWYARDTSKKIKSTFKAKGKSGKHVASTTPYGYLKSPDDHNQWIIDDEAAKVVRRIFSMTMAGCGPYQIAQILEAEKIEIPAVHLAKNNAGLHQNKTFEYPYRWCSSTIASILKKREYLGHTVNFKTQKHFKDKKSHYVSEDNWVIFENTQEPIIDQDTFDNVQRIRGNARRYPDGWGEAHPLTGLLYCADCGGKMYVHRTNNGKRIAQYTCANYSKIPCGVLCTSQHRINADVVLSLISEMLKAIAEQANLDRNAFMKLVQEEQANQLSDEANKAKSRIEVAKKRAEELEVLLCRIYEDNVLGKLPDERYSSLNMQYTKEKYAISDEVRSLEAIIADENAHRNSSQRFIGLIDKYENYDTLTTTMINEFIEKIVIHERDRKGSTDTTQEIEIYFNFIGRYVPMKFYEAVELTPEEQAELKKREGRRDKLHQNYLKRKEQGKEKEYYERAKAKKKQAMDEKKNELRAEDIEKGIFVPQNQLPQEYFEVEIKGETFEAMIYVMNENRPLVIQNSRYFFD